MQVLRRTSTNQTVHAGSCISTLPASSRNFTGHESTIVILLHPTWWLLQAGAIFIAMTYHFGAGCVVTTLAGVRCLPVLLLELQMMISNRLMPIPLLPVSSCSSSSSISWSFCSSLHPTTPGKHPSRLLRRTWTRDMQRSWQITPRHHRNSACGSTVGPK